MYETSLIRFYRLVRGNRCYLQWANTPHPLQMKGGQSYTVDTLARIMHLNWKRFKKKNASDCNLLTSSGSILLTLPLIDLTGFGIYS